MKCTKWDAEKILYKIYETINSTQGLFNELEKDLENLQKNVQRQKSRLIQLNIDISLKLKELKELSCLIESNEEDGNIVVKIKRFRYLEQLEKKLQILKDLSDD